MSDLFDINRRLPPGMSGTKVRLDNEMLPARLKLRFGSTDQLRMDDEGNPRELTSVAANGLVNWADRARQTFASIYERHWQSMADPTLPEAGRLVRSAKHARSHLDQLQEEYQAARAQADATLDSLNTQIERATKPPSDPGDLALDAEVRTVIRNESNHTRRMALAKQYARAVATAPEVLTGIGEEAHRAVSRDYLERAVPDVVRAFRETTAARDAAEHAHKSLTRGTAEFIDFERAARFMGQQYDGQEAA